MASARRTSGHDRPLLAPYEAKREFAQPRSVPVQVVCASARPCEHGC
jgi:hypothetical protein